MCRLYWPANVSSRCLWIHSLQTPVQMMHDFSYWLKRNLTNSAKPQQQILNNEFLLVNLALDSIHEVVSFLLKSVSLMLPRCTSMSKVHLTCRRCLDTLIQLVSLFTSNLWKNIFLKTVNSSQYRQFLLSSVEKVTRDVYSKFLTILTFLLIQQMLYVNIFLSLCPFVPVMYVFSCTWSWSVKSQVVTRDAR